MVNEILLGDAYELIKTIPDKSVDCVYTDIPYLFASGGSARKSRVGRNIAKLKTEIEPMSHGIDYKILDEYVRVLKRINCFIWCSKEQIIYILNYFKNRGCHFEILVWCKTNPTPMCNNMFLPDIEYCLYFREVGVALNDGYALKSKWYLSATNKRDKDRFAHPTIKPLDLVCRHIRHATQPNDIILDTFIGSGTTAVACATTNRRYIGMEIEPRWHAVAVNRLQSIDVHGQTSFMVG